MKRTAKPARDITVKQADGYHIFYNRGNGYCAMIDNPFYSAITLGWFSSETAAQAAIDAYRYDGLKGSN